MCNARQARCPKNTHTRTFSKTKTLDIMMITLLLKQGTRESTASHRHRRIAANGECSARILVVFNKTKFAGRISVICKGKQDNAPHVSVWCSNSTTNKSNSWSSSSSSPSCVCSNFVCQCGGTTTVSIFHDHARTMRTPPPRYAICKSTNKASHMHFTNRGQMKVRRLFNFNSKFTALRS